jgi:3-hydroxyisobutyrate dehydrogenase-like beta-hydroxyacid dehydrogenase
MGSRIAGRLLDAGHPVSATNRTAAKARPLIERGLVWLGSPREVAASTDVVLSMVTDDDALDAIATGPDGLLAGVRAGQVYADMRTVSPQASRQLAERLAARGAHMLDARSPAASRRPRAEPSRSWSAVTPHAFAAVEPLLRELGRTVTHVGPNGQGLVLKLAINISLAVQTLAFSEGLLLAERAGVDPDLAAEVMSTSSIGSPMLKARTPLLLHLPDHAWFDVELMQKDIRLARRTAADLRVPLPSAAVADDVLTEARGLGYTHRDLAALHDVLATTARTGGSARAGSRSDAGAARHG